MAGTRSRVFVVLLLAMAVPAAATGQAQAINGKTTSDMGDLLWRLPARFHPRAATT